MKKLRVFSFVLIFTFCLIIAGFVFAQRPLEVEYPEAGGLRPESTVFGLSAYVKYIFNLSIIISGLLAFGTFVAGGIRYITSVGVPAFKKDASEQMFAAFVGLLVLLTSYMLLTSINPELTMLAAPEITKTEAESVETPTLEKATLSYTEIPLGALIDSLFLESGLDNLKNYSKKVRDISNKVEQKTNELNSLVARCSCSQLRSQCPSFDSISEAACHTGKCSGNPCSEADKREINKRRDEIKELINNEEDGLIYWQKKLDREINGSTEEDDEYIGFRRIYEDLLSAEEMMKNCAVQDSKNGKSQFLLSYKDLALYIEYMADYNGVENFEKERPFEYIYLTESPFEMTTFYCAEMLYSTQPVEINADEIIEFGKDVKTFEAATLCDQEIFIGKDVDSSEELARRMLVELDNINDKAKEEIKVGNDVIPTADPKDCVIDNCSPQCQWIPKQCPYSYPCDKDEDGNTIYCQDWKDCNECISNSCAGSVCPGDQPKKSQINSQYNQIEKKDSDISSSYTELVNLMQERVDDDYLKLSRIFEILRTVQNQITACYNPKESYIKLQEAKTDVILRQFFTCSSIKEFSTKEFPFYDEDEKIITDCYSPGSEHPDYMDNLFCCKGEYTLE
ncbi:MAG TPA: hypothetical protein VJ378_00500 [Candidatus Paceibacterota bacterium]|nr:hypothetical protein [Candidatus Paceibacterota bacterium]